MKLAFALFLIAFTGVTSASLRGTPLLDSIPSIADSRQTGPYKSVIVLVPDGCDEAVQTLARWFKGEDLQLDSMANTNVKNHMANSVITGSAAAATAFACGEKTTVRFLGVGPRTEDLLSIYEPHEMAPPYAPIASVLEGAKLYGKSTGLIATSRISHATPAAFAAHIDDRGKDNDITEHIVYNNVDVVFGGGRRHLLPGDDCPNAPEGGGGKRTDCQNLEEVLEERGYYQCTCAYDLTNLDVSSIDKIFGLFQLSHLKPDVDRKHFGAEIEPSLAEMTDTAIQILSKNPEGFFLMVEGSQIDWAGHANDPFYMLTDFVAFDDAVKVAVDFAKQDNETLVLVFPDHNTGGMKIGNAAHGYTDVTVEALVGPFKDMTITATGLVAKLPEEPTPADIQEGILEYWGLNITEEDVNEILAYQEDQGQSLEYSIGKVITEKYTYIAFTTHGHNGETVPFWVYGMDAPAKTIDNVDIAYIVADAFGFDLQEITDELFVDLATTRLDYTVDLNDTTNPIVTVEGVVFPIGKDYMLVPGNGDTSPSTSSQRAPGLVDPQTIKLPGLTVYAPETGKVYISKEAVESLMRL